MTKPFMDEECRTLKNLPCAFSNRGITIYLNILCQISDRPDLGPILHVVPGTLTLASGRTYSMAQDGDRTHTTAVYRTASKPDYPLLESLPTEAYTNSEQLSVRLSIRETITGLFIRLNFKRENKSMCWLGPVDLICRLAQASNWISCPRSGCNLLELLVPRVLVTDSTETDKIDVSRSKGSAVVIRQVHGSPLARCLMVAHLAGLSIAGSDSLIL